LAYYVLADAIEVPNLGPRSNRYVFYLIHRYLFGVRQAVTPVTAPSERPWLFVYAFASFAYRMFIMTVIVLFVASQFFIIGVLLAIWAAAEVLAWPLGKGLWFLLSSPRLDGHRARAIAISAGATAVAAMATFAAPAPYATMAEGVVWVPEDSVVRAQSSGFVVDVLARPDTRVSRGDRLVQLEEPGLAAQVKAMKAELRNARVRYAQAQVSDRVSVRMLAEEIRVLGEQLEDARKRLSDLVVTSPVDGVFIIPRAQDLPGSFKSRGSPLGYVLDPDRPVIRVVVNQSDIDLLRVRTRDVEARLAERPDQVHSVASMRAVPAATGRVPSLALSTVGGGAISLDPRGVEEGLALDPIFELELVAPTLRGMSRIGGRAYIRFDHGAESLAGQLYRSVRQVFLERLNV
jgi:putative peptide zinc metalloprotease protein